MPPPGSTESRPERSLPEYPPAEGLAEISRLIDQKRGSDRPLIVAIAGPAAAGKTSRVAEPIAKTYGDEATLIEADQYYRGNRFLERTRRINPGLNWHHPDSVDLPLLVAHLTALRRGEIIFRPVYDFAMGEQTGTLEVVPKSILIVDGMFALHPSIAPMANVKVFVDIPTDHQLSRRLKRGREQGAPAKAIVDYAQQTVFPMYEQHVRPTAQVADVIISND